MSEDNQNDPDGSVCVHGLGYIGLPTAAMLARAGYDVYGFDVDSDRRSRLKCGEIGFEESDLNRFVSRALEDGLHVVSEPRQAAFHLVCVPTPYDIDLERTDLTYVEAAGETIADILRQGDTVILESTVPPGTTVRHLKPLLEDGGCSVPAEVTVAYSPETVLPGNTLTELRENDRLVGTVTDGDPDPIVDFYRSYVTGDIRTTNATTAEFVKLIQNAYRDVNIAFANEVAKLAHQFDIDTRDAIVLANNHPRVEILQPGPGVGGHCIPIDPLFLGHGNDVPMLIETARTVNDGMPTFVINLLERALGDLEGSDIALLGVAYKGEVGDIRQSPSLALAGQLEDEGMASVRFTDPYVEEQELDLQSLEDAIDGADAAVLVTDHPEYGALSPHVFAELMDGDVVVDTRGMLNRSHWHAAGLELHRL